MNAERPEVEKIREALADRKTMLGECPFNNASQYHDPSEPCPRCKSTTSGRCWVNVRADAIFVDVMKELAA